MQTAQLVVDGLVLGSIYALIAIGYTMVYGVVGMINFAHGEIYMIGAFVGLIVMTALSLMEITFLPAILLITLVAAMLVTSLTGWVVERVAYKPLRGRHRLIPLISAIGMSFFLQNYIQLAQGARPFAVKPLISGLITVDGSFTISYLQVIILIVTFLSMLMLTLFVNKTKIGWACRATEQDRRMANLLGINTDNIISLIFVIGSMLAAIAGVLVSLNYGSIKDTMGFYIGIKAFTAAVLGGIGSIPGAMIGGFVLGFAESFASSSDFIGSDYKDIVAFGLLLLILLCRPAGILGKPEIEKV